MVLSLARRFESVSRSCGTLAAVMALVTQLALGGVVLSGETPQTQLAALEAASIFCQAGHHAGGTDRPAPPHHAADYALCPLTVALAQPGAVLTPDVALPEASSGMPLLPRALLQARAPPVRAAIVGYPRGPPSLA